MTSYSLPPYSNTELTIASRVATNLQQSNHSDTNNKAKLNHTEFKLRAVLHQTNSFVQLFTDRSSTQSGNWRNFHLHKKEQIFNYQFVYENDVDSLNALLQTRFSRTSTTPQALLESWIKLRRNERDLLRSMKLNLFRFHEHWIRFWWILLICITLLKFILVDSYKSGMMVGLGLQFDFIILKFQSDTVGSVRVFRIWTDIVFSFYWL